MYTMPARDPAAAAGGSRRDSRSGVDLEIISHSLDQTRRIGARLAALLQPGDVILLAGEFGVGKTTLVQGLARGLGVDSRYVTSPTFTLINEYAGRLPLYHIDLYRLDTAEQVADLGLLDYLYGDGVTVIEWPQLAQDLVPPERLTIYLAHLTETKRALRVHADGARYEELMQSFKDQAFAHMES